MKTFFIVLVLCLGFLTTPINGVRPLTSSAPAPSPPTCSPTTPSPASKKVGSATFGFYLLGFLVLCLFYSVYSILQAGQDVEGELVVVREEVVPLRSPEAKLLNFVESAGAAWNGAKPELMKVIESLKKKWEQQQQQQDVAAGGAGGGEQQQQDVAAGGAGGGEQQQDVAAGGGDEIVAAPPPAVNSVEELEQLMEQMMGLFQTASAAILELEGALVLKLSIPAGVPALKKITRKKNKLDVHVERWTRRYEECREADFLGTYGRPFSQGMKHAIPTLWTLLKPFAILYLSVKMFWPAFAIFNGVPEWEDVWDPI